MISSPEFGLKPSELKFDPKLYNITHIECTENGIIWMYDEIDYKFLLVKYDKIVDEVEFPDEVSTICTIENTVFIGTKVRPRIEVFKSKSEGVDLIINHMDQEIDSDSENEFTRSEFSVSPLPYKVHAYAHIQTIKARNTVKKMALNQKYLIYGVQERSEKRNVT